METVRQKFVSYTVLSGSRNTVWDVQFSSQSREINPRASRRGKTGERFPAETGSPRTPRFAGFNPAHTGCNVGNLAPAPDTDTSKRSL
jgi:hypothetical protein